MRGLVVVIVVILCASNALAAGFYTGSDGKQVALGGLPKVVVVGGKISEGDFAAVLEANFNTSSKIVSNSAKVGLPTFNEFEQLVEGLSAKAQGKELAEKTKQEAQRKGWDSVMIGQKDGDYYSVAVVNQNGKAAAAQIICNSQLMLASTGPDKAMEIK